MEQIFDTPGRLHLELRIPAGSIRIRAEQTSQTTLSIRGERDPDDFRIVFDDVRPDEHHLTIEYRERGKLFGWKGNELRVDLTVPLGTALACDTGSADLEVTARIGSLTFRSGSGDCRFDDVDGDLTVKVASGDLAGATVGGGFSFNSASGDARVREIAGDVAAKSASGDLSLGTVDGSVRLATVSGDVEIESVASGSVFVRSVSGDVEIGVARGTRVYLDLNSTSGDTVSELDMSDASAGVGADLQLQVGTVSGNIRIVRASAPSSAGSSSDAYAAEDSASSE
jgi:putative adhesin